MNTYNVIELKEQTFFSDDLFLDEKFLLLTPELSISANLKNILTRWDFETVLSNGKIQVGVSGVGFSPDNLELKQNIEQEKLSEIQKKQDKIIEKLEQQYKEFLESISKLHETVKRGVNINTRIVSDLAKQIVNFVNANQKKVLLIPCTRFADEHDYLTIHELRTAIFAIVIGNYLRLPSYRLIELTMSALVHEIGMARIPSEVYNSIEPLSSKEKQALLTHPIISYNIVNASSFSLPICLACLEHHERENGAGYPRRLSSNRISLYGKILAVACSYEAATSSRPYRDAKSPTISIMEIIKNENKQYDTSILKALLYSISFFPIGVHVILSDGRLAQVVDVNPDDPRFPIVQIIDEVSKAGSPIIIGTDKNGVYISRTITKDELELMQNE